jgi:predicted peroxiredoxin
MLALLFATPGGQASAGMGVADPDREFPLVVHIAHDDPQMGDMALLLATNMLTAGRDVALFLDVKGVKAAVKTPPKELESVAKKVRSFLSEGGRVVVCPHCLGVAGFSQEDLAPGIEIGSPHRMAHLLGAHVVVISY